MLEKDFNYQEIIGFIGRQIAIIRQKKNIKQDDLARMVGISTNQLSKYEIGKNRISADRLILISIILKTNISKFLPKELDFDGLDSVRSLQDLKIVQKFSKFKDITGEDLLLKIVDLID